MAIPEHITKNFKTLLEAASDGNLALMECKDSETGETRYVICAVSWLGYEYAFTPFGHMAPGNPFEAYIPSA